MSVTIYLADLETLLVAAVRQLLWKRSYLVRSVADITRRVQKHLTRDTRAQLCRDIGDALAQATQQGNTVGADEDHATWKQLLADLRTRAEVQP